MASNLAMMKDKLLKVSIVGVLLLVHATQPQSAFAQHAATEAKSSYEWSAELVSFDRDSATATLKARLDARADRAILGELSEGDAITITWTGLTWGAGIGSISREGSSESTGKLDMPAQFVGTEMDEMYVVFRVPVPQGAASTLEALEPGTWVTATTPHDATELDRAVSSIRSYNDVS